MKAYDLIVYITVITNALLWGGIVLAFLWLTVSDPTLPDVGLDVVTTNTNEQDASGERSAPRHRA